MSLALGSGIGVPFGGGLALTGPQMATPQALNNFFVSNELHLGSMEISFSRNAGDEAFYAARVYLAPQGVALDKNIHQFRDFPSTAAIYSSVYGDQSIVNALAGTPLMDRQWSAIATIRTVRYADNFNRANGNLDALPASGGWFWQHDGVVANAGVIDTNQLRSNTSASTGSSYMTPGFDTPDHYVQFQVANVSISATDCPISVCRRATNTHWIGIRAGSGGIDVYTRTGGGFVLVYNSPTVALNDVVRLECVGQTWTLLRNDVVVQSGAIDPILISTRTGVLCRNGTTGKIDNFEAGSLVPKYGHVNTDLNNRIMASVDGINWTSGTLPADAAPQGWEAFCYSPDLGRYLGVASSGGTPNTVRAMTSPDGIAWTLRTLALSQVMRDVCWGGPAGAKLFVAVASSASTQNIQTSPDGITWTARTKADTLGLRGITWSPELGLFVAVGVGICYTSPDGITWTLRTIAANTWLSVCWSASLRLFVAVASDLTNRVATSPDGINWTSRTPTANMEGWTNRYVCWSPSVGRFVVCSSTGSGTRIAYSNDGITWAEAATASTSAGNNRVAWAPELGLFVCVNGNLTTHRVQTSPDGNIWTLRANAPNGPGWVGLCWGGGKFIAGATSAAVNPELISWSVSQKTGEVWRATTNIVSGTLSHQNNNPVRNVSAGHSTAGQWLIRETLAADANAFGFAASTDIASEFDSAARFKETPECAPQGMWDVYAFPVNRMGVEGPGATPVLNVAIV